ncbi:DnaD domain-containing protein [Virgibacillus ainsalahensis]
MNYIKQLNAFKDYLSFNEIPPTAILLWHTLMMINNMAGWKRRFNASNALVMQYGGLSKQRLSEARAVLVTCGLIYYERGAKGRAPVYEMVLLGGSRNEEGMSSLQASTPHPDLSADPLSDLSGDQLPDESRTIHKQKHKQKRRGGEASPNPFSFYDQNFSTLKPAGREVIARWCTESGECLVLEAMQIAVMHGGRTLKYIEKILNEWSRAGLSSLEQVRDFEKQKGSKQERKRSVPFWKKAHAENKNVLRKLREEMLA